MREMISSARPGQCVTLETKAEAETTVPKDVRRRQVLEVLHGHEMTAKEIAVAMYRKGYIPNTERNFAAPRLTEMMHAGVVEPIGKVRCEYTGKTVSVFKEVKNNGVEIQETKSR